MPHSEPEGLFGRELSVKAVFIHTRARRLFIMQNYTLLNTQASKAIFFVLWVKLPHGQCESAAGVGGGWERVALLSLTKERPAPSITDLIDACARALGPRPHFSEGIWGAEPQQYHLACCRA